MFTKYHTILSLLACMIFALSQEITAYPVPWPMPNNYEHGENTVNVPFMMNFIDMSHTKTQTIANTIERYQQLIFPHHNGKGKGIKSEATDTKMLHQVEIYVEDCNEDYPSLETDESYSLHIPEGANPTSIGNHDEDCTISLHAHSVYGAMRGMETLSQLIRYNFTTASYLIHTVPIDIKNDKPRFPHRGLLMDTCRHFQPLPVLKQLIDSMSYAKMNVLHWHLVDTQAFPAEIPMVPNLWNGAYSNEERYSRYDMMEIVEYARLRGVRVIPEFDMPGHAASWCVGYPEICPSATCTQPLNPASNMTLEVIENLIKDVATDAKDNMKENNPRINHDFENKKNHFDDLYFPDNFLHLGGDEVKTDCWTKSEEVQAWMKENNLDELGTYKYFVDKASSFAIKYNRHPIQWVEVYEEFGNTLKPETIVHVWKEKSTMDDVLQDGYRVLLSDQDVWYLDHLSTTWQQFYDNEPYESIESKKDLQKLILGGEVCMWAETVDTSDLLSTVWPRAAAFAERVWAENYQDLSSSDPVTEKRLQAFRCLLNRRGIEAAPVLNKVARTAPPNPGACMDQ